MDGWEGGVGEVAYIFQACELKQQFANFPTPSIIW